MTTTYSLGSAPDEQERLLWQSKAYGDLDTLNLASGGTLVECGCGVGANLWIVPHFGIEHYAGFDISETQITKAKQTAEHLKIGNAKFFCEDIFQATTQMSNTADIVLIRLVLIHLSDPAKALRNIIPILKPNGRLIVIEPDVLSYSIGPGKENLQNCFDKRCALVYREGRGSINIANQLSAIFADLGCSQIQSRPHLIEITGTEAERMSRFLGAWATMMNSTAKELLDNKVVTHEELDAANAEAKTFDRNTRLFQRLVICEGIRPNA